MNVAIVGAGPAGAWAALKLARAGARVTMFDGSHPREKPCGGGLTGRAVELDVNELGALPGPAVSVQRARFECDAGMAVVPLIDRGICADSSLIVVPRATFDGALLDAAVLAGAALVPDRVVEVDVNASRATIRTRRATYYAQMLLGADGANSLVRRRVTSAFGRHQISIGAGYFVHGIRSSEAAISFAADSPGYLWSFPRFDHLAVGICTQADAVEGVEQLRRDCQHWIAVAALANGSTRLAGYSWPIPSLDREDFDRLPLAGDRWMLLGDAAGLVDPLTREGIYYALRSGEMAAATIQAERSTPATEYRERLADTMIPELQRAAGLKRGFFAAGFSHLLVQALAESPAIRSVMVDLVAGRQPYIGLRRRLLGTLRFGLALRLVRRGWASAAVS